MNGNTVVRSIYGSVAINKMYCPRCKDEAFIINGCFSCCDMPVEESKRERKLIKKQVSKSYFVRQYIPKKIKLEILEKQEYKCIYCECDLRYSYIQRKKKVVRIKIHFDHFCPFRFNADNHKTNLVAACHVCNGIKSTKHFESIEKAREHIMKRHEKKNIIIF